MCGSTVGGYDKIVATGRVDLDGTANVILADVDGQGFSPAPGDHFEIISALEVVGDFDDWLLPSLAQGLDWNILMTTQTLTLTVEGVSADFDQDGDVDGRDFLAWQRNAGITDNAQFSDGDANGDQSVDDADLAVWQSQYSGPDTIVTVPEPRNLSLMLLGSCLLLFGNDRGHASARG